MTGVYPFDIPSIRDIHPHLSEALPGVDLSTRINAGDLVLPENLGRARSDNMFLSMFQSLGRAPEVMTSDVVKTSMLRMIAIAIIHANRDSEQDPVEDLRVRINALSDAVNTLSTEAHSLLSLFKISGIEMANFKTRLENRILTSELLQLIRKSVEGSGFDPTADLVHALEVFAADNPSTPIGTTPVFFSGEISKLDHVDILTLICFYNEDMGIEAGHTLEERMGAIRKFMTEE